MKRIIAALLVLAMSATAGAGFLEAISNKKTFLRTSIRGYQYNEFAEKNLSRKAEVFVQKIGRVQTLQITYDVYNPAQPRTAVMFSADRVDEYLEAIGKYRDWSAKATEAGDAFEKDIGKYPAAAGFKVLAGFYSSKPGSHYLTLTPCILYTCEAQSIVIVDADGAAELADLLAKLKAGELPPPDAGDKYN